VLPFALLVMMWGGFAAGESVSGFRTGDVARRDAFAVTWKPGSMAATHRPRLCGRARTRVASRLFTTESPFQRCVYLAFFVVFAFFRSRFPGSPTLKGRGLRQRWPVRAILPGASNS